MLVPDLFENIGAGAVTALGLLASRQLQRFKENVAELKRRLCPYQRGACTLIRHPVRAAFCHPVWPRRNCPEPYRHGSVQTVQAVRDGGSQHTGRSGP